ncbi:alpha/beta fold hydrolase [Actinomadura kijaniata]|uniref:alpha/beta fold hydrolase n=1 Tax=Actinomadura kijaniata TaxID=46161 RepID=UPI003F1BE9CB
MSTVTSADGTTIAYATTGSGPAVVLVATTAPDRHDLDGLAAALAPRFTVHNYDRRGRGGSGDTPPYAPEREVEDLAALLDAVGGPALLVSGSAGCVLALDAATALGERVSGLFLYEPPFVVDDSRPPVPADYVETVERLVAEGRRDEAVEYFMTRAVGVPAEYLEPMKADPSWATMAGYAHTLAYDGRIVAGTQQGRPLPADRWKTDAPVRVVVGENSPPFFHEGARALAALLANAEYRVLPGHDHSAPWTAPDAVAALV